MRRSIKQALISQTGLCGPDRLDPVPRGPSLANGYANSLLPAEFGYVQSTKKRNDTLCCFNSGIRRMVCVCHDARTEYCSYRSGDRSRRRHTDG